MNERTKNTLKIQTLTELFSRMHMVERLILVNTEIFEFFGCFHSLEPGQLTYLVAFEIFDKKRERSVDIEVIQKASPLCSNMLYTLSLFVNFF